MIQNIPTEQEDHRNILFSRMMQWITWVGIGFILIIVALYGYLYYEGRQPALIVVLGCAGLALLLICIAQERAGKLQIQLAGLLSLISLIVLFIGLEASLLGSVWINAINGLILILGLGLLVLPRQRWVVFLLIVIYAAASWMVNQYNFLPRISAYEIVSQLEPLTGFNTLRILLIEFLVPLISGLALLLWLGGWVFYSLKDTIRNRLVFSFVVLVLLTANVISVVSLVINLSTGERTVLSQMEQVNTSKQSQIADWIDRLETTLKFSLYDNDLEINAIAAILTGGNRAMTGSVTPRAFLQLSFGNMLDETDLFTDIFLINAQGDAIVGSTGNTVFAEQMKENWSYFSQGLQEPFISPIFTSQLGSAYPQMNLIVAVPITQSFGTPLGVLAARVNLENLNKILRERRGLGETGEVYLIDTDRIMLTQSRFDGWDVLRGTQLNTQGALLSQKQPSGSGSYIGYRNLPVLGYYQQIPGLSVALMAEQDQTEALRPILISLLNGVILSVMIAVLAGIGASFTARGIANPLAKLADTAGQIAAGNLDITADIQRDDEIGYLGNTFNLMTVQLRGLISNLEERVTERTEALQKRALQIQAASQIARDIAMIKNQEEMLSRAINLISDQFGYYHVGVFLADDKQEYAVLKAAIGEPGKEMMVRGHRLKIGEVGIVGYAVGTGNPRIALDVGADAVHFKNPLLPETRSELALPLKTSNQVIGALDVQSKLPSAFSEDDIQVLQIMADQLAVAIENTRLLEQLQSSLNELESTYQHITRESWSDFLHSSQRVYGYRYRNYQVEEAIETTPESAQAISQAKTLLTTVQQNLADGQAAQYTNLAVPIMLRNQALGVLNFRFSTATVSPELITLVENAATRLAVALENARLLEVIQIRSGRERQIGEISSKIRATSNIDGILRTAVAELGRVLGVSEVMIQLQGDE